jgi:predicted hydrocarbon binding protein
MILHLTKYARKPLTKTDGAAKIEGAGEMEKMEMRTIPEAAIQRNAAWIEAVEKALADGANPELTRSVMSAAGKKCAGQILADCEAILGKKAETVDELLEATNRRRMQRHNLADLWEKEGNRAHLKIHECACTLVKAGLARPNPTHCLCSVGMMESLFSAVCKGPVSVQLVQAVGMGDEACEFYVDYA